MEAEKQPITSSESQNTSKEQMTPEKQQALLNGILLEGTMGVCIKNRESEVLFQNNACRKMCGERLNSTCTDGCMNFYFACPRLPDRAEGIQCFRDAVVRNRSADVVVLNDRDHLVSFVYPLEHKYTQEEEYFKNRGLSKRELEVVTLVSRGATNQKMANLLHISKSTLKTHLNNIYRKCPELRDLRLKGGL